MLGEKSFCAFAPATIANVNVGFDILGIALSNIGDKVEVTPNGLQENRIIQIDNHSSLPTEASKNCCTVVIQKMQELIENPIFVDVKIKKGFASGSGLGSSSASSAAAAFAYNQLLKEPHPVEDLISFAAEGERIACGAPHLDNVAPALLGGLVLLHQKKAIALPLPNEMHAVSFFPDIEINTASARSIVPKQVPVETATKQIANMGAFVSGLYQNDLALIKNSLCDLLVEPSRKILIPYFDEMREIAMQLGAITFGISGSGPSVFSLAPSTKIANSILNEFKKMYDQKGIEILTFTQQIKNNNGAYLCEYND